jgi:hypothetical protein
VQRCARESSRIIADQPPMALFQPRAVSAPAPTRLTLQVNMVVFMTFEACVAALT